MTLPDDNRLLTFTDTDAFDYADRLSRPQPDVESAREMLERHGDVFRQHLLIAALLEEQANGLESDDADKAYYPTVQLRGYKVALRDTIADLRTGDFLPGGRRFEEGL